MKTQTFGIEVEMTGITRQRAAEVIAAHFGTTAQHTSMLTWTSHSFLCTP